MLLRLKAIYVASFVFVFLVLGGCVSNDSSGLDQYIEEVLARPKGKIEPLLEIKPYEAYTYKSSKQNARDPFRLFYRNDKVVLLKKTATDDASGGLTKEMEAEVKHRSKEELENFELDSLLMVGTMENGDTIWGIIQDPNGAVYQVRVGNYMGRNTGKVLNVFEDKVEIREIVRSGQGNWEERQAEIALVESE